MLPASHLEAEDVGVGRGELDEDETCLGVERVLEEAEVTVEAGVVLPSLNQVAAPRLVDRVCWGEHMSHSKSSVR